MYRTHRVFDEMFNAMNDLDRLFAVPRRAALRTLPGCRSVSRSNGVPSLRPAVDCMTRENDFVVRAELPGVDPEKIEITVHEGRLVLRGEKESAFKEDEGNYFVREAFHGTFERSFTLPEEALSDDISASYDSGVLEIVIPKAEEQKPRKVPVLAESARS